MKVDRPTAGRIVHYVIAAGPTAGVHRPLLVVETAHADGESWTVAGRLQTHHRDRPAVLDDGPTPFINAIPWAPAEESRAGTWHWPERE
jgi:hypothetical protein